MSTVARFGRLVTLVLVAAMASGCGSSVAPSSPPPSAAPTESPTPVPTATPAPTPDPYLGFVALVEAKTFKVRADVAGTVGSSSQSVRITGSYEADAGFVRSTQAFTTGGQTVASEQRLVYGTAYNKSGSMPWVRVPMMSGPDHLPPTLGAALGATSFTRTPGGDGLHLSAKGAAVADVLRALLLLDPTMTYKDGSVDVAVASDGTPVSAQITASGSTSEGGSFSAALTYTFDAAPIVAAIEPPADVWEKRDPGHFYTLWTPPGWTAEIDTNPKDPANTLDDYYDKSSSSSVYVNCSSGRWTLAAWAKDTRAFLVKRYGKQPTKSYDGKVNGATVSVLEWANVKVGNYATFVVNTSLVGASSGCDIRWYSDPGNSTEDYASINTILSSFVLKTP
jgi:hypothetical protein